MLLALDPGMNSPGVALFRDRLIAAGRVRPGVIEGAGRRWLQAARDCVTWARGYKLRDEIITHVVFECPQWYQRTKSKGDPNDLVGVAGVAANVTGILSTYLADLIVMSPTPAEWIGQLPKVCPVCHGKAKNKCAECHGSAWETPRGRRIRSRLTEAELTLVPDQNDAIDAVGIGLWALGRLEPRSVFSNGSDGR